MYTFIFTKSILPTLDILWDIVSLLYRGPYTYGYFYVKFIKQAFGEYDKFKWNGH